MSGQLSRIDPVVKAKVVFVRRGAAREGATAGFNARGCALTSVKPHLLPHSAGGVGGGRVLRLNTIPRQFNDAIWIIIPCYEKGELIDN
jgi:hypothetical protein